MAAEPVEQDATEVPPVPSRTVLVPTGGMFPEQTHERVTMDAEAASDWDDRVWNRVGPW